MSETETVILLHGLARTAASMNKMEKTLKRAGYRTLNCNYPSRDHSIESLAESTLPKALKQCRGSRVHFVTHSMGGILVRQYLSGHKIPNLGRTVMLSPPNQGSEIADRLGHLWLYKWLNGIAGQQLGTKNDSLPCRLGAADYELGIITGNRSVNLLLSLLLPGENDGKVSVARAQLRGMSDFLVMPVCHPLIMRSDKVIGQCIHFLQHGHFEK